MAADRRIDAAGIPVRPHLAVERIAHAVQALELEIAVFRAFHDEGDGQRIMGGELRVEARAGGEHTFGTYDIGEVGGGLAGEDREVRQPTLLRALDLGVPVGALDEADHETAIPCLCRVRDPVDHGKGALLVSLDGETEAVPAGERGICERRRAKTSSDSSSRSASSASMVRFRSCRLGGPRQLDQARGELLQDTIALARVVARMERGKLDRDARPVGETPASGRLADRRDRIGIGAKIALGVGARCARPRRACRRNGGSRPRGPRGPGRARPRWSRRGRTGDRGGASPGGRRDESPGRRAAG